MSRWTMMSLVFGALVACSGDDGSTTMTGDPVAGEAVYTDNCAICHAADGTGGTGPDITGETEEAEIADIVTNGEGDMTAFGDILSEQEIMDVAAYVAQSL